MTLNNVYIEKLIKLKKEIYDYLENNNAFMKGYNYRKIFYEKYIPLRLAFNSLKTIDDNINNFIVSYIYKLIEYETTINPNKKEELLCIVKKFFI